MTMKNKIALTLLVAAVLTVFTACTKIDPVEPDNTTPVATPTQSVEPTTSVDRPAVTDMIFMLEGMEETVKTELYVSPLGYSIYVDTERYSIKYTDEADRIFPVDSTDAGENASMEVCYMEGKTAKEVEPGFMNDYPEYMNMSYLGEMEIGDSGLRATVISANTGDEADGLVMQVYLIDHGSGVFAVKITCTSEAQEGHGTRLGQMLQTFVAID